MPFEKESVFEIDSPTDRTRQMVHTFPTQRRACEKFPRYSPYARAYRLRHLNNLCHLDMSLFDAPKEATPPQHPALLEHYVEGEVDDRVLEFVAENLNFGFGLVDGWFDFLILCLALVHDIMFGPAL